MPKNAKSKKTKSSKKQRAGGNQITRAYLGASSVDADVYGNGNFVRPYDSTQSIAYGQAPMKGGSSLPPIIGSPIDIVGTLESPLPSSQVFNSQPLAPSSLSTDLTSANTPYHNWTGGKRRKGKKSMKGGDPALYNSSDSISAPKVPAINEAGSLSTGLAPYVPRVNGGKKKSRKGGSKKNRTKKTK